jgi:hypothetical protein
MMSNPQKMANILTGATGQMAVAKKATAVVKVVKNMADAASGKATAATYSVVSSGCSKRAFFHLSTATKTSPEVMVVAKRED